MARRKNVFTTEHEAFLEALADLGHFQLLIGWQIRLAKDSFARSMEVLKKQGLPNAYGAANGMSIINIFHDGHLDIRAPYGKRVTEGEQLRPMAEEMERRFNSFLLVWVFELLEKHLMKLYGLVLFQLRTERTLSDKHLFHAKKPKLAKLKGIPQYYHGYADFAWKRNYKGVLDDFEKLTKWDRVTYKAFHEMPWKEYIEVIAFCRHRIVHNDGRVSKNSMNTLSAGQQAYVQSCFHESLYAGGQQLLPPTTFIDGLFEAVGSYAWALYVLFSERCGMADESQFFRPVDGSKRKVQPK
jgi:hypothetical protein